ncbi:archaeosortase/exosortase family protein [archaeon]|nr:archaeosortase/exosortase family protein [archaeon]
MKKKTMQSNNLTKAVKFTPTLMIVGIITYLAFSLVMTSLQSFTALTSSLILFLFGINSIVIGTALTGIFSMPVEVAPLCVGDLEIAVLVGAIAATEDRTHRERLLGIISGIAFVLFLNPIRIAMTIAAGVWWGFQTMDFIHSILFRITLVTVIIGFYVLWYLGWPSIKRKLKKH